MSYHQFTDGTDAYGSFETFQDDSQGWFWWACFPGCLPDCDPMGPFETEELAIADANGDQQ